MRRARALFVRLASIIARTRTESDLAAELDSHLQLHIDDGIRAGLAPDEARRRAVLALGGVEATKDRCRDRLGLPIVDTLRQDVACAARAIRKNPGFSMVAIVTLALGIGATTAIFSIVNAVLLRPLPFAEPDRLVMVYAAGRGEDRYDVLSYPTFVDWRDQSRTLAGAAAFVTRSVTLEGDGGSELVPAKLVSAAFFDVLAVRPALGRLVGHGDDADPAAKIAVLSDGLWRRRFGGDRGVIGTTARLSGNVFTIVGVLPAAFHLESTDREQLYLPLPIDSNRRHGFLRIVARLRSGVSPRQAQADLDAVAARLNDLYPRNEARASTVVPLVDALAGPSRLALLILFAIVTVLLVIACANVAGLLLARGAGRQREIALRAALGATHGRIARQLLTESLLLALVGGCAGLVVADSLVRLLALLVSSIFVVPRLDAARIDAPVLAFTFVVSVAVGTIFGIFPAWSARAEDLSRPLREAGPSASSLRLPRVGRALVIAQTALALVLLAGAGVLLKTLLTLQATDPGFDTRRMLSFDLFLPPARFVRLQERARFFDDVLARVRAVPGVHAAALVANLPLGGGFDTQSFHIVGRPDPAPGRAFNASFNVASAGYFAMMRIPIRDGRDFADSDGPVAPAVAIVNETAARRLWPARSPIGAQIQLPIARDRAMALTVVGVAADVRHRDLVDPPRPEIFLASSQSELPWSEVVLAVRAASAPSALAEPVKAALHAADVNVPLVRVRTMDEVVARTIAEPRLFSILIGAFAAAAVLLAGVGLYGLVSFTVTQRTRELSIRLALGASRAGVLGMVLAQGLRLAGSGSILGVAGALAGTRVLVRLTKGIQPNDPATFVAVVGVLFAVAMVATWVPARRAARVDPITALRAE